MAQKHSDDSESKAMAGQVGWIKRGDGPQQYERAVFSVTDGGLAPLIELDNAFFIASVEDYRPVKHRELEEVKVEIEQEIRKREAPAYTAVRAAELYEQWLESELSLEEFAGGANLVTNETADFLDQREDPEGTRGLTRRVLEAPQLSKQLIEVGPISVLVSVKEYQERDVPDLQQIRDQVVRDFQKEQARQLALSTVQTALERLRSGEVESLEALAGEYGFAVEELDGVSQRSPGILIAQSSGLGDDIFGLKEPQILFDRYYQIGENPVLVEVSDIAAPTESELREDFDRFREEASSRMAGSLLVSVIENRKKNSNIQINQAVYVD